MRLLERALGVEIEWNPLSVASRAARAERAGRIGEALSLYFRSGQLDRLRNCLRAAAPACLTRPLVAAAEELAGLERSVDEAPSVVPESSRAALRSALGVAAAAVWDTAERIAAVVAQGPVTDRLREELHREEERLAQIDRAAARAREDLARLTLAGGAAELPVLEERLGALASSARELEWAAR